ncbi:MAG: hypothetical protein BWX71_02155 [Deltaproteobacteria bacterium ADurb.Bin072]|nr:MAG: hypothetical protein BWX71_02155 [Deltaproteobacteria bacterium ADurb.Bin072]
MGAWPKPPPSGAGPKVPFMLRFWPLGLMTAAAREKGMGLVREMSLEPRSMSLTVKGSAPGLAFSSV